MKPKPQFNTKSDLKKYASQTRWRAVIWFAVIMVLLGLGLVWLFYGQHAAFLGLLCLLGAGIPAGLIAFVLLGLDVYLNFTDKK